jgi:glycosyltransferase involved in cell wall biosynthesis
MAFYGFLIAYAFVGCVYWLWMFVGTVRVVRAVPMLVRESAPMPVTWPRLSVIIPACNEAASLESALTSVLRQDYSDLEIILIDDRSTDGTAEIVDRMAVADPRITAIHVEQLPDGWLGKVHALDMGTRKAGGSWLLYTDADVHMEQGTLRRAIAYAEHHKIDHMAAMPEMWPSTLPVNACIALFARGFIVATRLWAVSDPKSDAFVGIGAFNLVRRTALQRTEGFNWLRLEVGDDMALGMLLKESGARSVLVNAEDLLGLYWYSTVAKMSHGAEKAYSSVGRCSLVRIVVLSAVLVAMEWSPFVALAGWHLPGLRWASAAMLAAAVGCHAILARWSKSRLLPGLLFPFAALLAAGIMLRSGWLGFRRGGVVWRGTLYDKDQLRAGRRLKLP